MATLSLSADTFKTYRRLLGYLRFYKGWFALGTLGALLFAATQASIGWLAKEFLDGTFLKHDPDMLMLVPAALVGGNEVDL